MIERAARSDRDIADIAYIEQQCFSTPWSDAQIRSSEDSTIFFLAKVQNQTVGYGGMYTVLDEGYVTNIGVLPDFRHQGIGRKIVEALIDFSIQRELSFLSLEVRISNEAAISLYHSLGFEVVGVRKNFYSHPIEDAKIMTRYFNQ